MKKMFLIIAMAALTAVGSSTARAGGFHFSFGLPLPPLPPLPGLSFGYPGYSYGYPGPVYASAYPPPVYSQPGPVMVYPQPYYAPYYNYGPRVYVAPRPWGRNGWGYRRYYRRW